MANKGKLQFGKGQNGSALSKLRKENSKHVEKNVETLHVLVSDTKVSATSRMSRSTSKRMSSVSAASYRKSLAWRGGGGDGFKVSDFQIQFIALLLPSALLLGVFEQNQSEVFKVKKVKTPINDE